MANSSIAEMRTLTGGSGATGVSRSRIKLDAEDAEGVGRALSRSSGNELAGVGSESWKSAKEKSGLLCCCCCWSGGGGPGLAKKKALLVEDDEEDEDGAMGFGIQEEKSKVPNPASEKRPSKASRPGVVVVVEAEDDDGVDGRDRGKGVLIGWLVGWVL